MNENLRKCHSRFIFYISLRESAMKNRDKKCEPRQKFKFHKKMAFRHFGPWLHSGLHPGLHTVLHLGLHPRLHPALHPGLHPRLHPELYTGLHLGLHLGLHPGLHPGMQPRMQSSLLPAELDVTRRACSSGRRVIRKRDWGASPG